MLMCWASAGSAKSILSTWAVRTRYKIDEIKKHLLGRNIIIESWLLGILATASVVAGAGT